MRLALTLAIALPLVACDTGSGKRDRVTEQRPDWTQRAKRGPYIAAHSQLSPHEYIRVIVIPEVAGQTPGDPMDDQRCVIYTNTQSPAAAMSCDSRTATAMLDAPPEIGR